MCLVEWILYERYLSKLIVLRRQKGSGKKSGKHEWYSLMESSRSAGTEELCASTFRLVIYMAHHRV